MELSSMCRECNEPIQFKAKDNRVVLFHDTCYTKWFKQVREYGHKQAMRELGKVEDE